MLAFRATRLRLGILTLIGIFFIMGNFQNAYSAKAPDRNQACVRMGTPHAWALALTAMLTERNEGRHDLLSGQSINGANVATTKRLLSDWWGIENKEDLLKTLQWLEYGGHREEFERLGANLASLDDQQLAEVQGKVKQDKQVKQQVDIAGKYYAKLGRKSILAWDYARYVFLCREGYLIGYLTEQEAWDKDHARCSPTSENIRFVEGFRRKLSHRASILVVRANSKRREGFQRYLSQAAEELIQPLETEPLGYGSGFERQWP